jgi:hypothetical protein
MTRGEPGHDGVICAAISVRVRQGPGLARHSRGVEHLDETVELAHQKPLMHELGPDVRQPDERLLRPIVGRRFRELQAFKR